MRAWWLVFGLVGCTRGVPSGDGGGGDDTMGGADTVPTAVDTDVQPGTDAVQVRHAIEEIVADFPVLVAPNRVLREGAIRIFDRAVDEIAR